MTRSVQWAGTGVIFSIQCCIPLNRLPFITTLSPLFWSDGSLFLGSSDQLEDNWEQEKKIRGEVEKARRKAEGDLKMTIENLNEMERAKLDLEEVVKK